MFSNEQIKIIFLIAVIFIVAFSVIFLVIPKPTDLPPINSQQTDLPPVNVESVESEKIPEQACVVDQDCDLFICAEKFNMICTSVQSVVKRCTAKKCECRCEVASIDIPPGPIGNEVIYSGDVYVKTDKRYNQRIDDKYQITLDNGSVVYFFHNTILTVYAIDIHHNAYQYLIWEKK